MKLLIKIYFNNINPYDIIKILDIYKSNIKNDDDIKIHYMTNESDIDFDPYEFSYLNSSNTPEMINYKLDELDWDIVIPIYKPCIPICEISEIKKLYNDNFKNLDGVLWIKDDIISNVNNYPVIGRNYFNNFNYIYNPIYNNKYFDMEFTEVMKIKNNYHFIDKIMFKTIVLKSDDDNIFELRKKIKFGII